MQLVTAPPARRHLLDRPQRLGFLPTLWFWNDHERHHLALPLVLALSLPLVPVLFVLVVRLHLPFWLFVVVNTLAPYGVMGGIERHIRGELRRRALARSAVQWANVDTDPSPPTTTRGARVLRGGSSRAPNRGELGCARDVGPGACSASPATARTDAVSGRRQRRGHEVR